MTDGCRQDVEHSLLQEPLLPFSGNGDALKLAVADDNGVIVAGGNAGAELLAVACLKVLFGSHKDIGGGVEPQELRRPLLRQVVRHRKEGFLAQAEALSLHGGGDHLKGLARAHLMGKERVAAVEVVGDGAPLMPPQRDLRIHARKDQVSYQRRAVKRLYGLHRVDEGCRTYQCVRVSAVSRIAIKRKCG